MKKGKKLAKKLPKYSDQVWEALAMFASLHDEVGKLNRREASQFHDALVRIYGSLHNGIEDKGYEVPRIPSGFYGGEFLDWDLFHVDLIEGGAAQLLATMHPHTGPSVTSQEVEYQIGWKARPTQEVTRG